MSTADERSMENAIQAGWNPDDGDPLYAHGDFQEGLETSDNVEDLIPSQEKETS